MKRLTPTAWLLIAITCVAVPSAVIVGNQMSADAMAVVVGVVCGVAAGIPTSILLLAVMNRRDAAKFETKAESWPPEPGYPRTSRTFHIVPGRTPHALPHPQNDRPPVIISGQDLIQRKEDDDR